MTPGTLAPGVICATIGSTDGKVTIVVTDTQRYSAFLGYPGQRPRAAEPRRDDYMGGPRHEVRDIALRILGASAVVLTFAGGFAYLLVRVLAS